MYKWKLTRHLGVLTFVLHHASNKTEKIHIHSSNTHTTLQEQEPLALFLVITAAETELQLATIQVKATYI